MTAALRPDCHPNEPVPDGPYCCPGAEQAISRAIHLSRLVSGYSRCRECPHRHETGLVSARRRLRLEAALQRRDVVRAEDSEGIGGVLHNEVTRAGIRRVGTAAAMYARGHGSPCRRASSPPKLVLAGDGRSQTAELVAAAAEGIRWAGVDVIDVGAATSAGTALAIARHDVQGGLLVGNPAGRAETAGVRLFGPRGEPLSQPGHLEAVRRLLGARSDRPSRCFGRYSQASIAVDHFGLLRPWYHALRPLRFVVVSSSEPALVLLRRLTETGGCRTITATDPRQLRERVLALGAHFGVWIGDDGETCRFLDERGVALAADSLAHLWGEILGERTGLDAAASVEWHAGPWESREAAARAFLGRAAAVAVTPEGRIWFRPPALPSPAGACPTEPNGLRWPQGLIVADALIGITLLLAALSRSDRSLSAALGGVVQGKPEP
jgi:hypothetical protein